MAALAALRLSRGRSTTQINSLCAVSCRREGKDAPYSRAGCGRRGSVVIAGSFFARFAPHMLCVSHRTWNWKSVLPVVVNGRCAIGLAKAGCVVRNATVTSAIAWRAHLENSFREGSPATVIIGTHCPALTPEVLAAAFDSLKTNPVVFGPATDGGYYLVGLARLVPSFQGVAWGTGNPFSRSPGKILGPPGERLRADRATRRPRPAGGSAVVAANELTRKTRI